MFRTWQLSLLFTLAWFVSWNAANETARAQGPRLVHVQGSHTLRVAPDRVEIEVTITSIDDDLIRVRANSDKTVSTILDFCKKHGVDAKGFDVSRLELSLDFNQQLKRQIYQVERDVTIHLSDISKLDAVLSELLKQENAKVGGITYATTKERENELLALKNAVADAQEKAKLLADLHRLGLGKAQDIRVINQGFRPFVTSVIPVVGAADPAHRELLEKIQPAPVIERGVAPKRWAFVQQPAANQPFGLGTIEFSAAVQIDYQLVD